MIKPDEADVKSFIAVIAISLVFGFGAFTKTSGAAIAAPKNVVVIALNQFHIVRYDSARKVVERGQWVDMKRTPQYRIGHGRIHPVLDLDDREG